ncbi:hypothetical protein ACFQ2J_13395 [Thalassobacillus hwangdonensis]|uniref:Oligosaccharide repeat unit polymerase n=1 Tax=Thalassobacillus hwangdonensis TaxID=546108 RepID=A0ABW3L285_9BACI
MIILLLSFTLMYFGDPYPFSLNKMFMLFSIFFFGISPYVQYKYGVSLWGGTGFTSDDYIKQNGIIIIIILTYYFLYILNSKIDFTRRKLKKENYKTYTKKTLEYSSLFLLIVAVCASIIIVDFNNYEWKNLFMRTNLAESEDVSKPLTLIITKFIYPIPIICLIFFKLYIDKNKFIEILLITLVLLTNFPTANARFYIAATYLPLLIVYFKTLRTSYMKLNHIVLAGFLIVFPFLHQFRRISNINEIKFRLDFEMFTQGHFDTYQMFMRVTKYNIITMGDQLWTTLLFFVPRSMWDQKSVASGAFVSDYLGLNYNNISMNYFGEGYINFGFLGILTFIIFLAIINARLDKHFWSNHYRNWSLVKVFYLFLLGLQFFILRGSLLSAFAYTIGIFSSICFIYLLLNLFGKRVS